MSGGRLVQVCGGPRCQERGSATIRVMVERALTARGLDGQVPVRQVYGVCHNKCRYGPNLFVSPGNVWYCGVQLVDVEEIVEQHIVGGKIIERLIGREPAVLQLDDRLPW